MLERSSLGGWLAVGLASAIVAGVYLPLVSDGGGSAGISDGGHSWFWLFAPVVALLGAGLVFTGYRVGAALAAGVGVFHFVVGAYVITSVGQLTRVTRAFGGETSPAIGLGAWIVAMAVTAFLVVLLGRAIREDRCSDVHIRPGIALGTALSAGALAIGMALPIRDHLLGGPRWEDALPLALIFLVPIGAALACFTRSMHALAFVGGLTSWYAALWFTEAGDFRPSGWIFISFRPMGLAWTTIGVAGLAACVVIGLGLELIETTEPEPDAGRSA